MKEGEGVLELNMALLSWSTLILVGLGVVIRLGRGDPARGVDGVSDFRAVKYEALLHNMDSFTEIGMTRVGRLILFLAREFFCS